MAYMLGTNKEQGIEMVIQNGNIKLYFKDIYIYIENQLHYRAGFVIARPLYTFTHG